MAEPMTPQRLDEIRKREQAATPGPWRIDYDSDADDYQAWTWPCGLLGPRDAGPEGKVDLVNGVSEFAGMAESDIEFIAHAREDVLHLLAEIERLAADLKQAQQETADALVETEQEDDALVQAYAEVHRLNDDLARERQRIDAALAEHTPYIEEFYGERCSEDNQPWPCSTVQALTGDTP